MFQDSLQQVDSMLITRTWARQAAKAKDTAGSLATSKLGTEASNIPPQYIGGTAFIVFFGLLLIFFSPPFYISNKQIALLKQEIIKLFFQHISIILILNANTNLSRSVFALSLVRPCGRYAAESLSSFDSQRAFVLEKSCMVRVVWTHHMVSRLQMAYDTG